MMRQKRFLRMILAVAVVSALFISCMAAFAGASAGSGRGDVLVLFHIPLQASSVESAAFEDMLLSSARGLAESAGARHVRSYPAIAAATGVGMSHMASDSMGTEELAAALSARPEVTGVYPNHRVRAVKTPNDPSYRELWGMERIGAPDAWEVSTGSRSVIVAVVDTGIDYTHPDLAANVVKDVDGRQGFDSVNNDRDPFDDYGHGTHVAGTIGAVGNNSVGVAGVNWTTGLLGVKVLDDEGYGTDAQVLAGLDYVLDQKRRGLNVRVVNMSIGGWLTPSEGAPYRVTLKALSDADVLMVSAAGNETQDIDNPIGYFDLREGWVDLRGKLCYPACVRLANTISVASTGFGNNLSSFSNYSPNYVDLASPGEGVLSTIPDNDYDSYDGTSMATPHVSGTAALLAAAHPGETASQIKARILNGVTPDANLNGKVARSGRLNASAAIRGETPGPGPDPFVSVTGVTISPETLRIAIGQSATLTAYITPANATNQNVNWTSSDKSIVDGVQSGLSATVRGVTSGSAVITVTTEDGGYTARCAVTVSGSNPFPDLGGCSVGGGGVLLLMLIAPVLLLAAGARRHG